MTTLRCDISISLDGFVAGPNATIESPLGDGVRLFDGGERAKLEVVRVVGSPSVTHVKYRVVRD